MWMFVGEMDFQDLRLAYAQHAQQYRSIVQAKALLEGQRGGLFAEALTR
jgi:hypothetical protein